MVKKNWKLLLICLLVVYAVAFLGSLFTSNNVNTAWYSSIRTLITPPNLVFPIVWNILFFLIALSLYFALDSANKKERKKIALVFGINLSLNILWSIIFFAFKNTRLAFFELIVFWVSILWMILTTWKINKKSAFLLFPYAVWVTFAGILNYVIAFG